MKQHLLHTHVLICDFIWKCLQLGKIHFFVNKFLPAVELPAFSELRYVLELQKVRVYQMLVSLVNYFCLGCVLFKRETVFLTIILFCSNNLWYFGSIIETRSNSNQYFSLLGVLNLPQDGVNRVDFAVLKTLVSMWR